MKKYIIITKKIRDKKNFKFFKQSKNFIVHNHINLKKIKKINPKMIFFIHWSNIIKKNIYEKYTCIQFHCSDLPKFRGGSPIQNQILKNINKTKITAFKVTKNLDSGDYCEKLEIGLNGNISDILKRIEKFSVKMLIKISKKKKIIFKKQKGKISYFKRRTEMDSNIFKQNHKKIKNLYDFIRMVDGEEYPKAYLFLQKYKIIFKNAKLIKKKIIGNFIIEKKSFSNSGPSR